MQNLLSSYRRYTGAAGAKADNEVASRYAPMVYKAVRQVAEHLPLTVDREDLFSAGIVGLLDALAKFDPSRGVTFEAYAQIRIKWAIQDELRSLDHLTRSMRRRSRTIRDSHNELEKAEGGPVSDQDVAAHTGMSIEEVQSSVTMKNPPEATDPHTLDTMMNAEMWARPVGLLEKLEWEEQVALVSRALAELPERNRLVVGLYYEAELTLKEIGEVLGVTQSRVSQILRKTEELLRGRLTELLT